MTGFYLIKTLVVFYNKTFKTWQINTDKIDGYDTQYGIKKVISQETHVYY